MSEGQRGARLTGAEAVADYLAAFREANPGQTPPTITQRPGGWWGIRSAGSAYVSPKRLYHLIEMTTRLRVRLALSEREGGEDG